MPHMPFNIHHVASSYALLSFRIHAALRSFSFIFFGVRICDSSTMTTRSGAISSSVTSQHLKREFVRLLLSLARIHAHIRTYIHVSVYQSVSVTLLSICPSLLPSSYLRLPSSFSYQTFILSLDRRAALGSQSACCKKEPWS